MRKRTRRQRRGGSFMYKGSSPSRGWLSQPRETLTNKDKIIQENPDEEAAAVMENVWDKVKQSGRTRRRARNFTKRNRRRPKKSSSSTKRKTLRRKEKSSSSTKRKKATPKGREPSLIEGRSLFNKNEDVVDVGYILESMKKRRAKEEKVLRGNPELAQKIKDIRTEYENQIHYMLAQR
jgi:hypothetical protein